MDRCQLEGCSETVSKPGHKLCYRHWQAEKSGDITACEECGAYKENKYPLCGKCFAKKGGKKSVEKSDDQYLSSTRIGEAFQLSSQRVNQVFAELGWIVKDTKGWSTTSQGRALGGQQREIRESGVPYVVWPETILNNKALVYSIKAYKGEKDEQSTKEEQSSEDLSFRERFPATHRSQDGHMVRSRAELLIDNWLYMQGLVHAYEKKLPVEEDVYCDFYLPVGRVYIEYWGLEGDPAYAKRKAQKLEVYNRHGYNLIELKDDHINNLDDHLPKMLLKYKIETH